MVQVGSAGMLFVCRGPAIPIAQLNALLGRVATELVSPISPLTPRPGLATPTVVALELTDPGGPRVRVNAAGPDVQLHFVSVAPACATLAVPGGKPSMWEPHATWTTWRPPRLGSGLND